MGAIGGNIGNMGLVSDSDISGEPIGFRVGTVVGGKFRIERVIAEGGMGLVVAATHLDLDQLVALKFFRAEVGADRRALLERFTREAKAAARLKSEHVARVFDVSVTDDGRPYMVIEYLEGQSLDRLLEENGPLDVARAVEYAAQACEGLAEAHARGIVHRDIKPSNLFLVSRPPGPGIIKILDFGISKLALSDASNFATNIMMGTPTSGRSGRRCTSCWQARRHSMPRATSWRWRSPLSSIRRSRSISCGPTSPNSWRASSRAVCPRIGRPALRARVSWPSLCCRLLGRVPAGRWNAPPPCRRLQFRPPDRGPQPRTPTSPRLSSGRPCVVSARRPPGGYREECGSQARWRRSSAS
jgi:serine/threonine protein kinase